ncbi:ketopantoate reductase [Cytobacillus firmus]|uniref:2-dehydropantoate 2-reductase n=2 Tax=Cytobacillus TaxID=2675230 RepID=A0A366JU75_CYTFI|nr:MULTISPECIES: 2-dehydropantoate 2-reductase [Cytobacillus]RBP90704.1 ketopantoate reductase [Cytobacillus firmus]TDX46286.1 ketopantoate reductase [Cytobacillus oceanisediminis]
MKIGIMGTGAVGGFFGSLLKRSGHEVIFIARGKNLEKMQQEGLKVYKDNELIHVDGSFSNDVNDLKGSNLILFCVKSVDTLEAARQIAEACGPETHILTLQNGVSNEEILSSVFGPERVFSAATYVQAQTKGPGVIQQAGFYQLVFGTLHASGEDDSRRYAELFTKSDIPAKVSDHILQAKWKKYIWNITFNPLSAVTGASVGDILDSPELKKLAKGICEEGIEVAGKLGLSFPPSYSEDLIIRSERAKSHKTSMLQDLLNGKKLETDALTGFLIRKAEEREVSVPYTETIHSLLKFLERKA